MANKHYNEELGARSLLEALDTIQDKLVKEYHDTDELVSEETNKGPLQRYIVRLVPDTNGGYDVGVYKDQEAD